jgi:hypothetical protein
MKYLSAEKAWLKRKENRIADINRILRLFIAIAPGFEKDSRY